MGVRKWKMPNKRDEDADNVLRYLTAEGMRENLCKVIAERMLAIEGFPELPSDLRHRIEEQAALLYAGGYLHAVKLRD